nr:ATP-binding protein [uncultured Neokomagataea sp.]
MLSILIFLADSFTNFEIATAVLYVSVVLLGAQFLSSRHLWHIAGLCAAMTVISLSITPHGNLHSGIINTALSITAIFATTLMATRMLKAIAAEHEARLQLIHLARVNTLGELSTSIAHEIKQPLTGIASSTSAALNWLSTTPPNIERTRSALNRITADATRTADIIERIRQMSRRSTPEFQIIHPTSLIQNIIDITHTDLLRNRITVSIDNRYEGAFISADEVQIQQVFINLIINAIAAIKATNRLNGHIVITIEPAEKHFVALNVSDNGIGIPEDALNHIFEPFHTTREAGTGLGLAICRSIIEAHGGHIHAFCSETNGTTFRFLLPLFSRVQ